MYEIGERMKQRFPELANAVIQDRSSLDLRYSEHERNAQSAQYFGAGFLGLGKADIGLQGVRP